MTKYKTSLFFIVIACFLAFSNVFAKSQTRLVSQSGSETVINFQLSEYQIENILVNGEECSYISVSELGYVHERGYPQLPRFSKSIIIPNNAAMGLEIVDIQYKEFQVKKIAPSKGMITRDQNPADVPYAFGEIYARDVWYPEAATSLSTPYIARDIRGIVVRFQPFQYNAVKGILKVTESMTVKIKPTGPGKINVLSKQFDKIAASYNALYKRRFLNYSQLSSRYTPLPDDDKMIVISASDFKSTMEPFVAWKNQIGIKTDLYEYPDETGGSGSSNLEDFIQGKYDDEGIIYILLVGDYGDMPSPTASNGASDPTYIRLAGSDYYPDAFIGRLSGTSTTHIETQVNKVLRYESEPDPSGEWYHKAMGIGSSDGSPKDWEWIDDMKDVMMGYNYTEIDEIYDPGASSSEVTSGLEEGRSWVNYMGHGSKSYWGTTGYSNTRVASLTNTNMLPVIISVACNNGEFDGGSDCLCEAFVKAGSPSAGEGAIVMQGSSVSQDWNPPQIAQREMVRALCAEEFLSAGAINYNGEMEMLDNGNGTRTFNTNIYFGDPSLLVFTDTPDALNVTHPASVPQGPSKVQVSFGESIDGRACLWETANGIAGSAMVSGQNSVEIDANVPNVAKVTLTVTGRNKVPFVAEINVGPDAITQPNLAMNMKVQCFPNPFTATANISFNNPGKDALVTIYNSAGKEILSEKVTENHFTWDAKNQTSGLYFVKVRVNDRVYDKRICLMK
jgi:gingipain R